MNNFEKYNDLIKKIGNKKLDLVYLNDKIAELEQKRDFIKQELPAIDEELLLWKKEIKSIKNKPEMKEELSTWKNEIKEIKDNKQKKIEELEKIELELKENTKEIKRIDDNLSENIDRLKKGIINNLKIEEINFKDLFFLLRSLKEIIQEFENPEITLIEFIKILKSLDVEINEKILNICHEIFKVKNVFAVPNFISDFILRYIKDFETGDVLDLYPTRGLISINLIKNLKSFNFYSFIDNNKENEVFRLLNNTGNNLNIIPKDSSDYEFDFVIGYIGSNLDEISVKLDYLNEEVELKDSDSNIELLRNCLKLRKNGKGIFLLDNDFILNRNKRSVFSNLKKFNLSIEAVIDISNSNLLKNPNKVLIIIGNAKESNLFVGSLSSDTKSNEILLANIKNKKEGKIPQYGAIIDINSFYSFKTFLAHEESLEMASNLDLNSVMFSEVIDEINILNKNEYSDNSNSIYIPLMETEDVKFSLEKARNHNIDYIQVILNEEKALAEYMATFFNTSLGRKVRESFNLDKYTLKFIEKNLNEPIIPLPNLDTQIEILRINALIDDVSTRSNTYRQELWKRPDKADIIRENVESLDEESEYRFERWIESLPFPLASILWESITNSKFEYRVKYLLQFFEAYSEFNVIFMLSGLILDDRFFRKEFSSCTFNDRKFKWFLSPSFGNWNYFGKCLAQKMRNLLRYQHRNIRYNEFLSNHEELLKIISSEEIYEIFDEVLKYRNTWEGHGPVVNVNEYENRYKILRSMVSKLYKIISNAYEDNLLVLPVENSYKDGIYYYGVKTFMGSRIPFKSLNVETVIPMDSNKIYFINKNQKNPIEILNLLKFKNNSCYYYNGFLKDEYKAQYVSYHNKDKPEILYPFNEIDTFVFLFENRKFNFY